jgi:Cobalamin-independent synthase, Catalytic domain
VGEQDQGFGWPAGAATGIGSMPGTDVVEACRVVFGELPGFPFLPELPGRGPGADLAGRTAALLVDMPVQVTPGGWKLTDRPGRDASRAAGYWSQDLDALEETAGGFTGSLKIQVCGPWTLAASLELSRSVNPVLADPGAVADLSASLAEGVAAHAADVRRRVPAATLVIQVDEPSLPAVLTGRVPTASGFGAVAAVDRAVATQRLAAVLSAQSAVASRGGDPPNPPAVASGGHNRPNPPATTVVHCCGRVASMFGEILAAGASAVSFDLDQIPVRETDRIAELAEAGLGLLVGALPTASAIRLPGGPPKDPRETAAAVVAMWRRTGLPGAHLAAQVVVTPACGLAGVSPTAARAALAHCREAARVAAEMIEESG